MQRLEAFIKQHNYFPKLKEIQGRTSIANMYGARNRCGIYLLHFENGEIYAGQATDVTRRYVQHRKTHDDITHISFKRVPKKRLNEQERAVIWEFEKEGFHLRNITFTSIPKGESDFDLIMPIEEQAGWLEGVDDLVAVGDRVQDETLRRKYQRKYDKFLTMPFTEESNDALRQYVQTGLPIPLQSEVAFWSCSCLPSYSGAGTVLYSRVNVNWQEVLTICTYQGILCFSFHLAIAPLQAVYGLTLGSLADKYPTSSISGHFYEPGGHDQFQIQVEGYEEFRRFLSDPDVKKAIRTFNLRLIKKGPCAFSRYHCMGLADKLLAC